MGVTLTGLQSAKSTHLTSSIGTRHSSYNEHQIDKTPHKVVIIKIMTHADFQTDQIRLKPNMH